MNDIFRPDKKLLEAEFEKDFIIPWADRRGLLGSERPRKGPWIVTVGDPKGSYQKLEVADEVKWRGILTMLRRMVHIGNTKNAVEVLVIIVLLLLVMNILRKHKRRSPIFSLPNVRTLAGPRRTEHCSHELGWRLLRCWRIYSWSIYFSSNTVLIVSSTTL
jgi:hypothetical protein